MDFTTDGLLADLSRTDSTDMDKSQTSAIGSFTLASYTYHGELVSIAPNSNSELDAQTVDYFSKKLDNLSGDLELPLESVLPGDHPFIEYRIGSDLFGAYVLFYFHDEVVFSSLMLSGTDEQSETELMEVFKFLHLETSENEDPTEEEIEAVLASTDFDFESLTQRPAVFEVPISDRPDELEQLETIAKMNRHLAAAFFAIER